MVQTLLKNLSKLNNFHWRNCILSFRFIEVYKFRMSQSWTPARTHSPLGINDDVIKWKHLPSYWPFVRGIHRSPVNSPCKGQWRGALMFSLICARINDWVNNREAGDLRRRLAHYDVTVMYRTSARATGRLLLKSPVGVSWFPQG